MNETAIEIGKEGALLRRFRNSADVEAFTEITRLYARMVYGTCLRVTGDVHHAADAAQETFYQLLKNAGHISGSLGGWLHQVATRRAIDLVRRDVARRRREQEYVALAPGTTTDAWADVSPLVDEAMGELEPELADILVRHFLQRETLSHIAAETNVSQPTISRRVEQGIEKLRERLRAKGVLVPAALGAMLASQTAEAVPAAVWAELGKMALTGSGAAATTATGTFGVMNAKLVAAAIIAVVGVGGYLAFKSNPPDQPLPPSSHPLVASPAVPPTRAASELANAASPVPATPLATSSSALPTEAATNPATPNAANATLPSPGTNLVRGRRGTGGWVMAPDGTRWSARSNPWPQNGTADWMIQRFTFLLSQGDSQQLSACFVPGAKAATGLQRLLENPRTEDENTVKLTLESLGLPAEVLETTPAGAGVTVRWRAKVQREFATLENEAPRLWRVGDWFELEAQLQQVGTVWKIAAFGSSKE